MEIYFLTLFIAGALGALAKDILKDDCLKLPKKVDNSLSLGFLGGMITGGFAGYFIDGSFTTAFLAGYTGSAILSNLVAPVVFEPEADQTIEEIIRMTAKEEGVDPDLVVRVAKCENSKLDPKAVNTNTNGSRDRGLFQINEKWHPEVLDGMAFNPIIATQFFCKAFKEGHLDWWKATKDCWKK